MRTKQTPKHEAALDQLVILNVNVDRAVMARSEFMDRHQHLFAEFQVGEIVTKDGWTKYRVEEHYRYQAAQRDWPRDTTFDVHCHLRRLNPDGSPSNCLDNTSHYGGSHPYMRMEEWEIKQRHGREAEDEIRDFAGSRRDG